MKWYWIALIIIGVLLLAGWYIKNTSSGVNNNSGFLNFGRSPFQVYDMARKKIIAENKV